MLEGVLKKWGGKEVSAIKVYRDIFRLGEHEIQMDGEPNGKFKANPVGYWKRYGQKGHYRILFEDTFEEILKELQEADFAILNGLTYFGRKNVQEHASKVYAMIFDLDGVTDKTLDAFLNGAFEVDAYPIPNYIALSGHGVHLYYVMEEPVSLYPYLKIQMKELKYSLTEKIWNMYTSTDEHKQFQGINQGFRVIGGKTKIEGVRVRAFQIHSHPFSITQLNRYIPREKRIDETKLWKESRMSLKEAMKKYPQWYEDKVINKTPRRYWKCKGDLYEWWKRKIYEGASYHHRYFLIMCLAIYGAKCGKDFKEVEKDAYEMVPFLDAINPKDPFTVEDCKSALECFDLKYCTFPIDDIVKISGILIEKNKRNGRMQNQHLQLARGIRQIKGEMGEKVFGGGRPQKAEDVKEWRRLHPEGRKIECEREMRLSRHTVLKWWIDKN